VTLWSFVSIKPMNVSVISQAANIWNRFPRRLSHGYGGSLWSDLISEIVIIMTSFLLNSFLKMSYTSEEEALKGIQKGDLWGYITVPENYTSHLRDRVVNGRFSESETLNGSEFGVALDMSGKHLKFEIFLKYRIVYCRLCIFQIS